MLLFFVGAGFQLPPPANPDTRGKAEGSSELRSGSGTNVEARSGSGSGDGALSGGGSGDE